MADDKGKFEGLDLAGAGKLAKAIPPEVYKMTTKTALTTFQKVIAPISATTEGLGQLIRQKLANMTAAEKALSALCVKTAADQYKRDHPEGNRKYVG